MPANPTMVSPQEYRQALRTLAQQQRAQIVQLTQSIEATLAADWQRGMALTPHLYQPLLDSYAKALAELRAMQGDPAAKLSLSWLTNQNAQIQQIEAVVQHSMDTYASKAGQVVANAQSFAVQQGAQDAGALVQQSLWPAAEAGVNPALLWNRPNPNALASLVGTSANGHPLGDLFMNWGPQAASQARQVLMVGVAMGDNPRAMATGLANALDISRQRATVIARTEVLNSYRDAALVNYRANSDVVGQWLWSAGGPNPCAMCMGMDGLTFELWESFDEHVCGACMALPVTKPWSDILGPLGIDTSDMPDYSLANTYIPGVERFDRMPAAQQRAIIGTNAGYKAYKNGEITLRDFVGQRADGSFYQRSLKDIELDRNAYFAETASTRGAVEAVTEQGVTYASDAARLRISDPIGRPLTDEELTKLTGAPPGSSIEVSKYGEITATLPDGSISTSYVQAAEDAGQAVTGDTLRADAENIRTLVDPGYQNRVSPQQWTATIRDRQQAKAAMLAQNPDWQHFVAAVAGGESTEQSGLAAVETIEDAWSHMGLDANPFNVAVRQSVQDIFNLQLPTRTIAPDVAEQAATLMRDYGGALRAYAQATYDQTQQWFADHGITDITLYRGSANTVMREGLAYDGAATQASITGAAISSYSNNSAWAYLFAENAPEGEFKSLIATHIPVSQVFGTPFTSAAHQLEEEFLVLGSPKDAVVLSWKGELTTDIRSALDEIAQGMSTAADKHVGPTLFNWSHMAADGVTPVPVDPETLAQQAQQAQALGFDHLHIKGRTGSTDSTLLPQFGYDTSIKQVMVDSRQAIENGPQWAIDHRAEILPPGLGDVTTLQELLATPEGQAWWEANSVFPSMDFDLTPGSESWRILNAYLRSHGLTGAGGA